MIVSLDARARVVSLLDYRRTKAETQMALPLPENSPLPGPPRPLSRREARHRARMLEHLASLATEVR